MAIPIAATATRAAAAAVPAVKGGAAQVLSGQLEKRADEGKCVPCFSPAVKRAIRATVKDPDVLEVLDAIPDCLGNQPFRFCSGSDERERGKRGRKEKRPPSEYQQFISVCMKGKNIKGFGNAAPAMKDCAADWRRRKGK